jgi:hypothetical protein
LTIVVSNSGANGSTSVPATFTVTAATLTATGETLSTISGTPLTAAYASFVDGDASAPAANYTASIDWGDGSPNSAGTVSGSNGSFTVTATHTFTTTTGTAVVSPLITISSTDGQTATAYAAVTVTAPVATIPAGLSLVSLPYNYAGTADSASSVLGGTVASYTGTGYTILGSTTDTMPGVGYWVNDPAVTNVTEIGAIVPSPFTSTLRTGWNLVGDPFTSAVPVSTLEFTVGGGTPEPLATAIANGLITSDFFGYDQTSATTGQYVTATTLVPFQGYWIYVDPTAGAAGVAVTYNSSL